MHRIEPVGELPLMRHARSRGAPASHHGERSFNAAPFPARPIARPICRGRACMRGRQTTVLFPSSKPKVILGSMRVLQGNGLGSVQDAPREITDAQRHDARPLGASMKRRRCGNRPARYYPAKQSDTPGFVRSF